LNDKLTRRDCSFTRLMGQARTYRSRQYHRRLISQSCPEHWRRRFS